jgi:ribosome-associated protein
VNLLQPLHIFLHYRPSSSRPHHSYHPSAELLTLRADLLAKLPLSDKLVDAILEAKRITNFEGRRRQLQFVGKLMRRLETNVLEQVRSALNEQNNGSAAENLLLHQAEQWRERMMADDQAVSDWIDQHPETDTQHLRALVRQARKEAVPEKAGAAVRHGRTYRDIYQLLRDALNDVPEPPAPLDTPTFNRHEEAS